LVLTGPGEQGADQAVLALEQVEQHAGARSDRRRQRAERQLADPVFQDVAVGPVEQLDLPGGRRVGGLRHAEDPVAETNVSAAVYAGPATPRPDRRLTNRWAATPTAAPADRAARPNRRGPASTPRRPRRPRARPSPRAVRRRGSARCRRGRARGSRRPR